tara:strand:- start:1076 stop:1213 length:138 start_codon:yes stop_codon:yes gene_type:complete
MKNSGVIIKQAEKIKAVLVCVILLAIPVYELGYKLGGIIGVLFVS